MTLSQRKIISFTLLDYPPKKKISVIVVQVLVFYSQRNEISRYGVHFLTEGPLTIGVTSGASNPDKVIFLPLKNVVFTMEIICHNSEFLMIEVI